MSSMTTPVQGYKEWCSVNEAAHTLSCSTDLVRSMIRTGELEARKFGRIIRIRTAAIEAAGKPLTIVSSR